MTPHDAAPRDEARAPPALSVDPPRAGPFIVTIYGDVVEPRGGTLAMSTLIDCCARHAISQSLVRTAVSRLVGGGRLVGERVGRNSFYRLSDAARAEFRDAARVIFVPPAPTRGWLLALGAPSGGLPPDWAVIGPQTAIAPDRDGVPRPDGPILSARTELAADIAAFAARLWPLADVAATACDFIARFGPFDGGPARDLDGGDALALRLQLVHAWRHAALADPRIPPEALPADWPIPAARDLFRSLYLDLSPATDAFIGERFLGASSLLPAQTPDTRRRLADMGTG